MRNVKRGQQSAIGHEKGPPDLLTTPMTAPCGQRGTTGAANPLVLAQKPSHSLHYPSRAWFEATEALMILISDTAIAIKNAAPTKNS
jgi:hypothetical protein